MNIPIDGTGHETTLARQTARFIWLTRWLLALVLGLAVGGRVGTGGGAGGAYADQPASPIGCPSPATYDPLAVDSAFKSETLDVTIHDDARSREIPIRVYLPVQATNAPVILFSHGLGGSRENNPYLGNHWAARGYVVVYIQHIGSDESVWKGVGPVQAIKAMKQAANLENFMLRVKDVPAVIDQLEKWNKEKDHPLADRMDLSRLGMTGHSFGALTTQAVSGQTPARGSATFTEARIKAALPMSPSSPKRGDIEKAFAKVTIPWLLMTGTKDDSSIGDQDPESRMAVYPALPAGSKYELVLFDATHMAFGQPQRNHLAEKQNPNHHRAILALSTAFWDAYLKQDASARFWLDGDGPSKVLEPKDRWQKK